MTQQDHIDRVIVRRPGQNLGSSANASVGVPDFDRARMQHAALCEALKACGATPVVLKPDPQFPDGSFVGDMAVVADNVAVIGNFEDSDPRQGEQQAAAAVLAGSRFLKFVTTPGRLDAADVLNLGGHYYIGLSDHTNQEGAAQLAFFLTEFGHEATVVETGENAPRLSACAVYLGDNRLLIRKDVAQNYAFLEYEKIILPPEEKGASSALMVNGTLILPAGYPRLRGELRLMDIPLIEVNVSEFEKTGGSLSCLALPLAGADKGSAVLAPGQRVA